MSTDVLAISAIIFMARVMDVSLGTLRTMTIVRGRRRTAFILGFFEVVIWVFAVSRVIDNLQNPLVALAYALGFATGSVVGMTLERFLNMGQRVVRILSTRGHAIAEKARELGYVATEFPGHSGGKGPVTLLYIEVGEQRTDDIIRVIHELDPECFYIVEEVRVSATPLGTHVPRTGWLSTVLRK